MHSIFHERITEARRKRIMQMAFVKENIHILFENSRRSFINSLLFVVLKNDYQAHSISAYNIISLFKSWQSTGKIYFQYPQAYWEPRAFFSSLCKGSVTIAIGVKRRKKWFVRSTNLYFYSAYIIVTKYSLFKVS